MCVCVYLLVSVDIINQMVLFLLPLISSQFARFETIDLSQVALAESSCRNLFHSFCVSNIGNDSMGRGVS